MERKYALVRALDDRSKRIDKDVARGRTTRARHFGPVSFTWLFVHGCTRRSSPHSSPSHVVGPWHTIAYHARQFDRSLPHEPSSKRRKSRRNKNVTIGSSPTEHASEGGDGKECNRNAPSVEMTSTESRQLPEPTPCQTKERDEDTEVQ